MYRIPPDERIRRFQAAGQGYTLRAGKDSSLPVPAAGQWHVRGAGAAVAAHRPRLESVRGTGGRPPALVAGGRYATSLRAGPVLFGHGLRRSGLPPASHLRPCSTRRSTRSSRLGPVWRLRGRARRRPAMLAGPAGNIHCRRGPLGLPRRRGRLEQAPARPHAEE